MIRRPPRSTRTDTLCPYTTLFRSTTAASMDRDWSGCCDRQHQDFTWRCPLYVRYTVLKRGVVRRLFAVEQLVFAQQPAELVLGQMQKFSSLALVVAAVFERLADPAHLELGHRVLEPRSEESRVGQECFSTWRF